MNSMQLLPYKQQVSSLLRLGLPIVVGQLGMIILGLADTIMIGHHSTEELAAAAFVNNVFNLAIIFATGFSYGLTPLIGMLQGGGNTQGIGRVFRNALAANASVAVLLTAVMYTVYCFVDKLGQPEELLPHIRPYFVLQLISLLFIMLFNGFRQFAEGLTDTRTPMWILLGGNALNIFGNYLLIYGSFGFPEWGLFGAGGVHWSRVLSCCWSLSGSLLLRDGIKYIGRRFYALDSIVMILCNSMLWGGLSLCKWVWKLRLFR